MLQTSPTIPHGFGSGWCSASATSAHNRSHSRRSRQRNAIAAQYSNRVNFPRYSLASGWLLPRE
jgi:hypothetical protein